MNLIPIKHAEILDGLSGMNPEETKRIKELQDELIDEKGEIIQPKGFHDYYDKTNKYIEFSILLQKRNELWLAKLN